MIILFSNILFSYLLLCEESIKLKNSKIHSQILILHNLLAMYFESLKRLNGLMKEFRMSLGEER